MSAGDKSLVQRVVPIIGGFYVLIGIVGFFVTGFDNFFGHSDESLLIFHINPAHNVVHILIGVAGLLLGRTLAGARTYGWLLAVGEDWDFLNINAADNGLHIATTLVGLAIALLPVRDAVPSHAKHG